MQDSAEFAAGLLQEAICGEQVAVLVVHDDGEFDFTGGFFEKSGGVGAGEVGELHDDAGAAVGPQGPHRRRRERSGRGAARAGKRPLKPGLARGLTSAGARRCRLLCLGDPGSRWI